MIDKSLFTNSNFGLKALGFSDEELIEWNKVSDSLRVKGLQIVEFDPKLEWHNRWFMIIEPKLKIDNVRFVRDRQYVKRLNANMKNGFASSEVKSDYWTSLFAGIDLCGFIIPVDDLRQVDASILNSNLDFYHLHLKYFPYQDLMVSLSKEIREHKDESHIGGLAVWYYIYYYSIFLHRLRKEDVESYELYSTRFSEYFDKEDYYKRLPSEQVTMLLLSHCESLILNPKKHLKKTRAPIKGMHAVRFLFDKYEKELDVLLLGSEKELLVNLASESFSNIQQAIINVFLKDKDAFALQELLDNKALLSLHDTLPLMLQLKYGPNSIYNVTGIIKDKIFDSDEWPAGQFKEDIDPRPKLAPAKHRVYIEEVQYWYDIKSKEREKILEEVDKYISNDLRFKSQRIILNRCMNHWINLMNTISAPILAWEHNNGIIFPKWNTFDEDQFISLVEEHQHNEAEVIIEQKLLMNHLERISKIEFKHKLDAYLESNSPLFTYGEFRVHWDQELRKANLRIEQRERFYETRMRELGIYESHLEEEDKNICLREMMQIEEEVRPYIPFVKRAFQTALPIRRTVRFSANRHASSGVEFDPDTLFDQEKWIRANVMKVMESSVERGDAVQINTFCLDFSGSMEHVRMRNLFKILYLLVLGLEDRKSFDAFHFFSNNFIEVVNFTNEFTSRKVLFRILRQISQLQFDQVIYGGYGATNMSEGMEKSLDKMAAFTREFKSVNPDANVVTSMFVISDGAPNMGVTNPQLLNQFVNERRNDGGVEIKAIFIKSKDDEDPNFLNEIFGEENCVESADFKEGVERFVSIMTKTYKKQRETYKWQQKKRKLGLSK